uniref:MIF4G domain-containing protein n=1 Tax=Angiostrongylus cantonensis TaxID=6313 RepID=A0A0K0CU45_ANGCA
MSGNPNGSGYLNEEDPVEVLIRRTGCWEQHIAVVDCMGEKRDWRQCQVQEYKVLLGEFKHNRTHSVAVLDSLIRCALKTLSCPADDLLRYLHEYKQSILDYGDQLQYLTVAKEIYAYISCEDAPQKFVEVVCLLCATTGLPEHWLAFGERNLPNMGKNFHIGYVTRAIMLLERQIKGAHGFVVRAMEKKLKNCIDRLAEMECSDELIREARLKMGVDLISIEENVALCDDFRRPAHDCRLKSGLHMNGEDLKTLLMTFQEKFVWMFEGCSL